MAGVYDPALDRMVLFSGRAQGPMGPARDADDVWALDPAGTTAWSQLSPGGTMPGQRRHHAAALDEAHHRMVIFGGEAGSLGYSLLADAAALEWGTPTTVLPAEGAALALLGLTPNPASRELIAAFSLAVPGRIALRLLDVSGRRVLERSLELPAGAQRVRLGLARELPPGVYLLELAQGTALCTRRVAVIR
jgi:hypothetical protein